MTRSTMNRSRTVDWSQAIDISSLVQNDSPRLSAMGCKQFLGILSKKNTSVDAFRPYSASQRKRRRALVENSDAIQPRSKIAVTEPLFAQGNARYSPARAISEWSRGNAVARWVRREVGERLVRNCAHLCAWAMHPTQQQREFVREMAVAQRRQRRESQRRRRTEELGAETRASFAAAATAWAALDHSPLARPRPPPQTARPPPSRPRLTLAEDDVHPEAPHLERYWELWPGDLRRGEFSCEYCEERFEVTRDLRLHHVDAHLCMTGGAGPAGALA